MNPRALRASDESSGSRAVSGTEQRMTSHRTSLRIVSAIVLVALGVALVPGSSTLASADDQQILKFAVMVPRTPELAIEEKKYNKRLAELTNNTVQTRVYW